VKNKRILIIGGTGALGKTLISTYNEFSDIMVFSRDEHKQVNLQKQYPNVTYQIGDVKDKDSILKAINSYKPEIVINTAALKHVPVCEVNPIESVQVNILGHQNLLDAVSVSNHKIETLVFISTDKACKPINVYGMCKAISEKIYMNFAKTTDIKTVIVRYGNVLESTGSVIPYFKSLLDDKTDYLPITDVKMTRFLLSLRQAINLIQWAYDNPNSHGKIAIPKVKSMKITDIAKALIDFYECEVELKEVGIRDGEKLHEEMISSEESAFTDYSQENYLIGSDRVNDKLKSYDSEGSLMSSSEVLPFLRENGVV
tara:strand:+ start:891 stop:1832 length:942 start_codon:yes stop_codon:yes gene_type:complete